MTQKVSFLDCLEIGRRGLNSVEASANLGAGGQFIKAAQEHGMNIVWAGKGAAHLEVKGGVGSPQYLALQNAMKAAGMSSAKEDHELIGAAVREPIRILARYKEWTTPFFSEMPVADGEDNAIPIDQPIGSAFVSSPEGRPQYFRPGVQQWVRPTYSEIKGALEILWRTLRTAQWAILSRRLEETSDSMALQRDTLAKTVLDAAITAASHNVNTASGGLLTKLAVDTVIGNAAQIGFPITQMAINPGRLVNMTVWNQGTTSALPWSFAPENAREQIFRQLFAEGYGGLRYIISHNVPMGYVYLSGDPADTGYHQTHGATRSMSDVDMDNMSDKHLLYEDDAYYVGNQNNVWMITIVA